VKDCQRQILEYLKNGGELTVLKSLELFKTTELRRVISRLREDYLIADRWSEDRKYKIYYIQEVKILAEINSMDKKIVKV